MCSHASLRTIVQFLLGLVKKKKKPVQQYRNKKADPTKGSDKFSHKSNN